MDEEELCAEPEGVLLADGGDGACFLVSRLELAAEVSGAIVGRVGVEDAHIAVFKAAQVVGILFGYNL